MTTLDNLKFKLNEKENELKRVNLNQFTLNKEVLSLTEEINEIKTRIKQEEDKEND